MWILSPVSVTQFLLLVLAQAFFKSGTFLTSLLSAGQHFRTYDVGENGLRGADPYLDPDFATPAETYRASTSRWDSLNAIGVTLPVAGATISAKSWSAPLPEES